MFGLFRRNPLRLSVERFYVEVAAAARNPDFFTTYAVPDTFEGRFEILILHVALVQVRFRQLATEAEKAAQLLTDSLFADLDAAIREAGVSDVGVPRKMKMLAEAYFGRLAAYETAMRDERGLAPALVRNIFGEPDGVSKKSGATQLADYCNELTVMLVQRDYKAILMLRRDEFLALTSAQIGLI